MQIEDIVKKEYPNARTGEEITDTYLKFLETEYGSDLSKMLFATSLCSDDINISTDFRKVLSRPFTMGGLGGLPFSGFTGMVAFGHHIPDGGDAFIFFGPHIGITNEGELGKMIRPGQSAITNSCGALMLALERMSHAGKVYIPQNHWLDMQQNQLENTIMPFKSQILAADNPIKEITSVTYDVIYEQVHLIAQQAREEIRARRLFLLGGVIINTSPEFADYVDIRHFEAIDLTDMQPAADSILESNAFKNL